VQEDLGSILHPNPEWHFFGKLSSPFFQTTDLKTIKLCDVMLKPNKKKITKKIASQQLLLRIEFSKRNNAVKRPQER
jgi:hypothetical protein